MTAKRATQRVLPASNARPAVHTPRHDASPAPGELTSINVVLNQRHIALLDLVRMRFRVQHQAAVSRGEIIRVLVELMAERGIDFSQFGTVKEMTEDLMEHFRAIPACAALGGVAPVQRNCKPV